jgi:hypothetical protein
VSITKVVELQSSETVAAAAPQQIETLLAELVKQHPSDA